MANSFLLGDRVTVTGYTSKGKIRCHRQLCTLPSPPPSASASPDRRRITEIKVSLFRRPLFPRWKGNLPGFLPTLGIELDDPVGENNGFHAVCYRPLARRAARQTHVWDRKITSNCAADSCLLPQNPPGGGPTASHTGSIGV